MSKAKYIPWTSCSQQSCEIWPSQWKQLMYHSSRLHRFSPVTFQWCQTKVSISWPEALLTDTLEKGVWVVFPGMPGTMDCLKESSLLELVTPCSHNCKKRSHFYLEFPRESSHLELVYSLQPHLSKESLLSQMSEGIFTPYSDTVLHR